MATGEARSAPESVKRVGVIIPAGLRRDLFRSADEERLDRLAEVTWTDSAENLTVPEAVALLSGCHVGVGSWGTPHPDAGLMAGCPGLELWVHGAGTVKHMFGPHLEGRGLTIASCAPAIAENVAEITLAQLIVGLRRNLENWAANRTGPAPRPQSSRTLAQSTVGVIGASLVGRRVVRNLLPFFARDSSLRSLSRRRGGGGARGRAGPRSRRALLAVRRGDPPYAGPAGNRKPDGGSPDPGDEGRRRIHQHLPGNVRR